MNMHVGSFDMSQMCSQVLSICLYQCVHSFVYVHGFNEVKADKQI